MGACKGISLLFRATLHPHQCCAACGAVPRMTGAERLLKWYGWEGIGDHPMTLTGPERAFSTPGGAVWPPSELMLLHEPTVTGIIEMDM